MPTCTCRRCSIASDLPFSLSEQRQRQRHDFLQRQTGRQTETNSRATGTEQVRRHADDDLQPEPEQEPEQDQEPEPEPDRETEKRRETGGRHVAATSVLLALAGESRIDLGPLSIHVRAGAATLAPAPADINTIFPAPASTQVHRLDVVPASECDHIVSLTEQYLRGGGQLTTDRHRHFPTTDIPVADVPSLDPICQQLLQSRIAPSVCECYGLPPGSLLAHDLFIVYFLPTAHL